jgi:hypothetical protein
LYFIGTDKCYDIYLFIYRTKHNVELPIVSILNHAKGALIQLSNGQLLLWNEQMNIIDPYLYLPEECTHLSVMDNKIYALGISKRLFENDKVILNNIGSFCIRYPFVLAATLNQRLIVLNIHPTKVIKKNIGYYLILSL